MSGIVVEVGPATVQGPNSVDAEWVSAGINGIEDELTLVDDRPVAVAEVWRTVMHDVVGGHAETIVVVCPSWWTCSRVDLIRDAASAVADEVVMLRRAQVLSDGLSTVVEIAQQFVLVWPARGDVSVVQRGDAEAIAAKIPMSMAVVVDSPDGVEGADPIAAMIADRLRLNGVAVTIAGRDWVRRSVEAPPSQVLPRGRDASPATGRGRRGAAVLAGAVVSAVVLCVGFAARQDAHPPVASMPLTLLVEGRLGVMVPARWAVERITSGPGSARVQVVSPDDADIAVHLTQSSLAWHQSREQIAESLRSALSEQPDGVFVEFNPSGRRGDEPVATYREIRQHHHILWVVLVDKSLRIAVGCQSAPGREEAVREACDQAIRSAHSVV